MTIIHIHSTERMYMYVFTYGPSTVAMFALVKPST